MESVAVIGAKGMLGSEVLRQLKAARPNEVVSGLDLPELDITSQASVDSCALLHAARAIINCAAFTDVDGAETREEEACNVNAEGVARLGAVAAASGALLVHLSTDYVFDGGRRAPYSTDALPQPLSAYGQTKYEGEQALAASGARTCLVRSAWLFGTGGPNFVETVLRRARAGEALAVVDDQEGAPTYTRDLAGVLIELVERETTGVFHCTNDGSCSWYDFARAIVDQAGLTAEVARLSTAEATARFGLCARRPAYSVLECSATWAALGRRLRPWRKALGAYLEARARPVHA